MPASTKPFLKWPGGTRWLVPYMRELIRGQSFTRYIEPFLGGGAVFFGLGPSNALIADINPELINVYLQVQSHPARIVEQLKELPVDENTYRRVRDSRPSHEIESAVRFLYLNRTAFAGIFRLNRQGSFNVPFGGGHRTPAPLWKRGLLTSASEALRGATIMTADFEHLLNQARTGDLVYCDPTYTVNHNNNSFIRYNERNFSWEDQRRLARSSSAAAARGAFVIVSNADHVDVKDLYPSAEKRVVGRWSGVCPRPSKRQRTSELLLIIQPTAS